MVKVTRTMVAERAGVSKESVSYVLNNSRPVSKEIVEKVNRAVKELGYVPDVTARILAKKSSNLIGIICNDISNPYYSEIIYGIESSAEKVNYSVIIADAKTGIKRTISEMLARHVDGIAFLVFPYTFDGDYSPVINAGVSVLVTHNTGFNSSEIPHIEPDFENGYYEALKYLKDIGHKDVVMFSAFPKDVSYDTRRTSFEKHYKKLFNKEPMVLNDENSIQSTLEAGRILADKFIKNKIKATAIICTNDLMAIGAIEHFKKNNIKIPDDVSVIGVDDMMFSSIITPKLSTLGYDKRVFGNTVFEMLYSNIKEGVVTNKLFSLNLIVRESVKGR